MRLITIILLCFAFNANAQKATTGPGVDSLKITAPPDSIAIVSLRDMETFYKYLGDIVPKNKYEKLTPIEVLNHFYQWAVYEYDRKQKKRK